MTDTVRRGDIFLISLEPARGEEIRKTRPCVVISPDELNAYLHTYIVAPLTTGSHQYPFRISCRFQGRAGHIVLDQIRTIDRERMVKKLGKLPLSTRTNVLTILQEMFTP
jgi:mRNA interferase MazF